MNLDANEVKKVLLVNGSFSNDSGAGIIADHTEDILKLHNIVTEVYTSKSRTNLNKTYKYANLFPSLYETKRDYLNNIFKYYYNWTSEHNLTMIIEDFQPDVVHLHSLRYSSMTYSVLHACKKSKVPVVMTLHDCFLICPCSMLIKGNGDKCDNMPCKGYNKFYCIKNGCSLTGFEQSVRFALMSFVNKLSGLDDYVSMFITPSSALRNLILKAKIGIDESRITTINNFLSDKELHIKPNYNNKGYFLYAGRLSKEKGLSYLLQAVKSLPDNIEFHIVGAGKDENKIQNFIKQEKLSNVKLMGLMSHEDLLDEYQNCIATILPCNWFENFPTTNMESFINGKPVIASNIGGIPEQVEHNKTGLLFEPANIEQLKESILKYWNNSNLVIEHGKNAYQKAIAQYTSERYYKELIEVYNKIQTKGVTKNK